MHLQRVKHARVPGDGLVRPTGRKLVEGPAVEPVSVPELKDHARIDGSEEDPYLDTLIQVARRSVEERSWRPLITQTWEVTYDAFPAGRDSLRLPLPPLREVVEVTYVDPDGETQELTDYRVDDAAEPARLTPELGATWPSTHHAARPAVTVRMKVGYGDGEADVPANFRQAILLTAATLYMTRENVALGTIVTPIPGTAEALVDLDHAREVVG